MSEVDQHIQKDPTASNGQHQHKAIVVFSDGTGNSAAKVLRTNVWRLYRALDLDDAAAAASGKPRQIAYYDDGVGTSSFRPLALLGGAFGWGLKRNVLDLYAFICRNYEAGDRIYAFGFSRGAFTIRVLVSLIDREGLLLDCTEQQLAYGTRDAYRSFRRCFTQTGALVRWLRNARDQVIRAWRRYFNQADYRTFLHPVDKVEFVGVWDTVAAYGMPIAELTRGIDKWVWPLSLPDYALPKKVKKACHALALDDERDTFHPLLWDEREESDPGRLEQVWFAGMHSDVGGGYPDDALAHVTLKWMVEKAQAAGLRFKRFSLEEIDSNVNELGPIHDSRRGVAAYYRYQPRRISARVEAPDQALPDPTTLVMQNPDLGGQGLLRSVKIHESVFKRIRSGTDSYAPVVLPASYEVVRTDGTLAPEGETSEAAAERLELEEATVWNDIWRRRVNYYLTVAASLFLILMPWFTDGSNGAACQGPQCFVVPLISGLGTFLPGFAQTWLDTFEQHPGLFLTGVVVLVLLLFRGGSLQRDSHDAMRALWAGSLSVTGVAPARSKARRWFDPTIFRMRRHPAYQGVLQALKWRLVPHALGLTVRIAVILLILAGPLTAAQRVRLVLAERSNEICRPEWAGGTTDLDRAEERVFATSTPCWHAGRVVAGNSYALDLELTASWMDGQHAVHPDRPEPHTLPWYVHYTGVPLRRYLSHSWYQPLAKIMSTSGRETPHLTPLTLACDDLEPTKCRARFVATQSGDLYLFVNDAVVTPLGFTRRFYRNNAGEAMVSLNPIAQPTISRSAPAP